MASSPARSDSHFVNRLVTTVRFKYPIWTLDSSTDSHRSRGSPEHARSYTRASYTQSPPLSHTTRRILDRYLELRRWSSPWQQTTLPNSTGTILRHRNILRSCNGLMSLKIGCLPNHARKNNVRARERQAREEEEKGTRALFQRKIRTSPRCVKQKVSLFSKRRRDAAFSPGQVAFDDSNVRVGSLRRRQRHRRHQLVLIYPKCWRVFRIHDERGFSNSRRRARASKTR